MIKQLSYDTTVLIEAHLEQALKELEREIFLAKKNDKPQKAKWLEADRHELQRALDELSAYSSYIANYTTA